MECHVQVGKDKSSYKTKYSLDNEIEAWLYFNCLNTHSGYKKRLVIDGKVVARVIT